MSLFKYKIQEQEHEIEADYYKLMKETTVNDEGEESIVFMYVFYEDKREKLKIPAWFSPNIKEV